MNWIDVLLVSVVEGLTEFVPVSSTGHMILVSHWIGFNEESAKTFMILIQLGAILAAFKIYWTRFMAIADFPRLGKEGMVGWLKNLFSAKKFSALHILLGILPVIIMGLLFYKSIKELFQPVVVAYGILIGGVLMVIVDRLFRNGVDNMDGITPLKALLIGFGQCLSLIPGVSRSGATIVSGLICGVRILPATDFAFILSVPIMVAATAYELYKTWGSFDLNNALFTLAGFVVAFVVSYYSIRFFLTFLKKFSILPFGVYRIILGALMLYLLY